MKQQGNVISKLVIVILALQVIAGLIIAFFLYNLVIDPDSSLNTRISQNIQEQFAKVNLLDLKGDRGPQGEPGQTGQQGYTGATGEKGDKGDTGNAGQDGATIVGPQGVKGEKGDAGPQGETGTPGPVPEFRCNPDVWRMEYKYPNDEDWTRMNASCKPSEEVGNG